MDNKLSVISMLNLIENMSYDDKQILINKLTKTIFSVKNMYYLNEIIFVEAYNIEEVIDIIFMNKNFMNKLGLISTFCDMKCKCGLEFTYHKDRTHCIFDIDTYKFTIEFSSFPCEYIQSNRYNSILSLDVIKNHIRQKCIIEKIKVYKNE
jgi:hypothetical protein